MSRDDLAKVRSAELRAIAEERSPSRQVVVVKVRTSGNSELRFEKSDSGRPRIVGFATPARPAGTLDAARQAMEIIAGSRALNAFASSNAVVIEVNGEQLRRIAALPEVQEIYPNDLP